MGAVHTQLQPYSLSAIEHRKPFQENIPLSHNVSNCPCPYFVPQFLLNQLHSEFAEILGVRRPVKTELHSNLHHHSTQHECRVCRGTAYREGPRAK